MARTLFELFWNGISPAGRDAWVRRSIWALAKTLEKTFWSRSLLESADDIVLFTLQRLLTDPTGEYAPHGEDTAEDYFRRCVWLRVKAVDRMARASKRRFVGPNHVELDESTGRALLHPETPETLLAEREAVEGARDAIARAVADSRLRGVTREYAENFVEFAARGLSTADIARLCNTNEGNVRSARLKLIRLLVREGVIDAGALGPSTAQGAVEAETFEDALSGSPTPKRRH